jgi:transposase
MVVGIDVHKQSHTAALLDPSGALIETVTIDNSSEGAEQLRAWLAEHSAEDATIGIENGAGYGRLLCGALAAAGHVVLNVPAWRTKRDRHAHGPGKSDAGDAIAVAEVVLRRRHELGPALEPQLVRALSLLEGLRRQSVYDRTQAIQRLRAIWTQIDPQAESQLANCATQRALRTLKRLDFGSGLAAEAATHCVRELAREIEQLNQRISELDHQLELLLREHGNPLADLPGAGPRSQSP